MVLLYTFYAFATTECAMVFVATVLCIRDIVPALTHCTKGVVVALDLVRGETIVIVMAVKGFANIWVPFRQNHLVPFPDFLEWRIVCTSFTNNVLVPKQTGTP